MDASTLISDVAAGVIGAPSRVIENEAAEVTFPYS